MNEVRVFVARALLIEFTTDKNVEQTFVCKTFGSPFVFVIRSERARVCAASSISRSMRAASLI